MVEQTLEGRRVLVVEDEYLLADDLTHALEQAGAAVLGPVPGIEEALALIAAETQIDAAVLDVNLRGEMVFPVADALVARGIPFAFATGYDEWALPDRFAAIPRLEKPFKPEKLALKLLPLVSSPKQIAP
jgi:CheY-like chemotaxis protein